MCLGDWDHYWSCYFTPTVPIQLETSESKPPTDREFREWAREMESGVMKRFYEALDDLDT